MYLAAVIYFNGWAGLTYEPTYAGKHAYGFGLLSVIGLFCYNVLTVPRVGNESANIDLAMSLPVFLMGSLLALIYHKVKNVKISPTISVLLDAICWVFFAVFIYNCQENPIWFNKPTIGNNLMVQSPILTVILLLALMTTTNGSFVGFFEWNFLRFCGKISYSMYLTHVIAIDHRVYLLPLLGGDIGILGVFLLAIGLATIGYHLVEVPIANTMVHLSYALKKYYLNDKKPYLPVNSEENRN
ncbi:hypothetical protein HDV04_002428 [Boothiomyces sp. JEL0838]|nr:hypothetical protein HDV04_002428 [Boothiomyces sp. JEL0838]